MTINRGLFDYIERLRHPWSSNTVKQFLNKHDAPLKPAYFKIHYCDRILGKLEIRDRKFYATRHEFITDMVKKGISLKAIGNFVGTSVTIIEQYYSAKLELHPDQSDEQELFEKSADKLRKSLASPTGFEPVLSA